MTELDQLSDVRQMLRHLCSLHVGSLGAFGPKTKSPSFLLNTNEELPDDGKLAHLTTTATCLESLLQCPPLLPEVEKHARDFARLALEKPQDEWKSDQSAQIYCRCRGLPLVLSYMETYNESIDAHIKVIVQQLTIDSARMGIGEAYEPDRENWYPPNAYHTYWWLSILEILERRFKSEYARLNVVHDLDRHRGLTIQWIRQQLALQVSLHQCGSSYADPDQLGWAISSLVRYAANLDASDIDVIASGLRRYFEAQHSDGSWHARRPLFHYQRVGNAYCYVFETLAALLSTALLKNAPVLLDGLRPYVENLRHLVEYAQRTVQRVGQAWTWSSGHRINNPTPEGWATASVFAFLQSFRRLIGVWTREAALRELRLQPRAKRTREQAVKDLRQRGSSQAAPGQPSVGETLEAFFVNPALLGSSTASPDIDEPCIQVNQSRSAILFGPPGTSKTTLVRAIADAVGWDFVELHSSHFVADGMPDVQRTSERIFSLLRELDRCVVFFDEVDELVRERDQTSDAFGRFLTTSMLPRLAELWAQRRVMFFVATNHVEYFDAAITRSERFDHVIFVAPPSIPSKLAELQRLLKEEGSSATLQVDADAIQTQFSSWMEAVKATNAGELHVPGEKALARFVAVRWDELSELALSLKHSPSPITNEALGSALAKMRDNRLHMHPGYKPFAQRNKERRDHRQVAYVRVASKDGIPESSVIERDGSVWMRTKNLPPVGPEGPWLKGADEVYTDSAAPTAKASPAAVPAKAGLTPKMPGAKSPKPKR